MLSLFSLVATMLANRQNAVISLSATPRLTPPLAFIMPKESKLRTNSLLKAVLSRGLQHSQ